MAVYEVKDMDQIQQDRQKIIAKLVKIKALAERGIGGEQQTAQVMYTTLKEKYKVTDAEIEKALRFRAQTECLQEL